MTYQRKRGLIIFALLFNLAIYISMSMFFIGEKGVNYLSKEEMYSLNNNVSKKVFDLYISEEGKGKGFFVENYNSAWGDGSHYMAMALGYDSIPPYSLRPFMPKLVGGIADFILLFKKVDNYEATKLNILQPIMSILNSILLAFATFLMFFIIKKFINDDLIAGIISMFMLINIGNIQTAQFFMLDSASYVVSALIMYFFVNKKYLYTSISIAVGLLVKEVMIIYGLLLLYPLISKDEKVLRVFLYGIIPLTVFVGIRIFMNLDPLSMQYGWNISKGEIKLGYFTSHLGSLKAIIFFAFKIFFTFGILWFFALLSIKIFDKKLLITFLLIIIAIIFANALLASRVLRVIFVVFPIIAILATVGISNLLKIEKSNDFK